MFSEPIYDLAMATSFRRSLPHESDEVIHFLDVAVSPSALLYGTSQLLAQHGY